MIKLIIFDLDDTLYNEIEFVMSGFEAVSEYLFQEFGLDKKKTFKLMKNKFTRYGRGQVFNDILKEYNFKYNKKLINKLVSVYRSHTPSIKTYPKIKSFLVQLKSKRIKLALVTDTRWQVQRRKVEALELNDYFDYIVYTDKYNTTKLNPKIIKKIIKEFNVRPGEAMFIGDDPNFDFIATKKLGGHTIRIRQGRLKKITLNKNHEADSEVDSISQLIIKINKLVN